MGAGLITLGVGASGAQPRFRNDIQALRGYAVLAVLLYHAGVAPIRSGYLGVDMFFVVSGFLITRIVNDHLTRGDFSFAGFYARRVRRLIPALYMVLLITTLAAAALLTSAGVERLWTHLTGAITFVTNIVLWRQINYFNTTAAFEPLLHLWSLAVEEQYYLLLPPLLLIVPARLRLYVVTLVTLFSFALYVLLASRSPGASFYLLPTRAWELGIGSVGSFATASIVVRRVARALLLPSLATVLAVPFLAFEPLALNPGAIAICLATIALMLARHDRLGALAPTRVLARLGDISYSLYLIHWPLFALAHNLYLGTVLPSWLAGSLVVASLILAELSSRLVEQPFRSSRIAGVRLAVLVLVASIVVFTVATVVRQVKRTRQPIAIDLAGVTGLPNCGTGDAERFDGQCANGAQPEILVWGDSFSQHIMPGVLATTSRALAQASKGHCGAFANLAPMQGPGDRRFAEGCLAFNRSVLAYLRDTPSIRVVAISSFYSRYLDPSFTALRADAAGYQEYRPDAAKLSAAQLETTAAIRAMNKRVVIVSGPPLADFDVGLCWDRRLAGLPILGSRNSCQTGTSHLDPLDRPTRALMATFVTEAQTPVIRLDEAFCPRGTCTTTAGGMPLYRDDAHMSATGSRWIGRQLQLGERIWRDAR